MRQYEQGFWDQALVSQTMQGMHNITSQQAPEPTYPAAGGATSGHL